MVSPRRSSVFASSSNALASLLRPNELTDSKNYTEGQTTEEALFLLSLSLATDMIVRELRDEIKQVQLLKGFCCDSELVNALASENTYLQQVG